MLRLILGLVIVAASILTGYYLSSRLSRRRDILSEYIRLLEEASNRMSYTMDSLAQVFSDNFAGFRFDPFLAFAPQWDSMTARYRDVLNAGDRRVLSDFARGLGGADIPSELRHIALYQGILRDRLTDARAACERKGQLYRILPFSIGLTVTILLL